MKIINDKFMLENDVAYDLYHNAAKHQPIYDFHCHLSAQDIYEDKPFKSITEIWLYGDHYKWRLMRFCGVDERYITGNASDEEKFEAYAKTIENAIGNPLYHWSMLELNEFFGINECLNSKNWKEIYDRANKYIRDNNLSPRKFISQSNVYALCTTNNPYDDLDWHEKIRKDNFATKVMPGMRPDEAFFIGEKKFLDMVSKMENKYNVSITNYDELLESFERATDYFIENGARAFDHGFGYFIFEKASKEEVEQILEKALRREKISYIERYKFVSYFLTDLAGLYIRKNIAMLFHVGAYRNNNSKMFEEIGPDTGFDIMIDQPEMSKHLNAFIDNVYKKFNTTPKMVWFNLNNEVNKVFAATMSNFTVNAKMGGKLQVGTSWWFHDTESGMIDLMKTFSEQAVFGEFLGMLTDSRSFVSYTRFDYFRRILCNYIGDLVTKGKFPNDTETLQRLTKKVCFENAKKFFESN